MIEPEEDQVANAELSAAISEAANRMSFTNRLMAEGVTAVTVDAEGDLVERSPDGTTTVLRAASP